MRILCGLISSIESAISSVVLGSSTSFSVFWPKPSRLRPVSDWITMSTVYSPFVRLSLGTVLADRYPPRFVFSPFTNCDRNSAIASYPPKESKS